jgi:phage tail protein X
MDDVKPVHRYKAQTMFSFGGAKIEYFPHGPEVVLATEFDAQRLRAVTAQEQQERHRGAWFSMKTERDVERLRADTAEAEAQTQYAKRVAVVEELAAAEQRIAEQLELLREVVVALSGRPELGVAVPAYTADRLRRRIYAALNSKTEAGNHEKH